MGEVIRWNIAEGSGAPVEAAERDALSALCAELPELRAECSQLSEEQRLLLRRIEDRARARRPVLPLLRILLGADPDETRRALSSGLPDAGPGQAAEERFECPDGACARVAFSPYPAGPIPRCLLTGQPMRGQ
ncbi:hypothetical protein OG713_40845 [Streptomyces sp. NBC_00723]|uniref:hypothetical protein n=1 Tax=Streptomyces sp. NBC_00723 TaxID=2903673 RepID=UPI003869F37F